MPSAGSPKQAPVTSYLDYSDESVFPRLQFLLKLPQDLLLKHNFAADILTEDTFCHFAKSKVPGNA